MARPRKESDKKLIEDAWEYLRECEENDEIPQVLRFAHRHNMTKNGLYYRANQNLELLTTINRIIEAKQLVLEEGALTGKFNSTMSVFSLKQLGWKDKVEDAEAEESDSGIVEIPSVVGNIE